MHESSLLVNACCQNKGPPGKIVQKHDYAELLLQLLAGLECYQRLRV